MYIVCSLSSEIVPSIYRPMLQIRILEYELSHSSFVQLSSHIHTFEKPKA
jgi:hypothetical protein